MIGLVLPILLSVAMPRIFLAQSRASLTSLDTLSALQGKIQSLAASANAGGDPSVVQRDLGRLFAITGQGQGLTGLVGFASGVIGGVCLAILYLNALRGRRTAIRANFASVLLLIAIVAINLSAVRYARVEAATAFAHSTTQLNGLMSRMELMAIASRDEGLAKHLLQFTDRLDATDDRGSTALHLAAERGMESLTREIVRTKKQDVDAHDGHGATPLMRATASANPNVLSLLIAGGADVGMRDKEGRTPLHLAAVARRTDIARMLLDAGANVDAEDSAGRTPLAVAYAQSDDELFAFLVERGANVGKSAEGARLAHEATAEAIKAIGRSRSGDVSAAGKELLRLRDLLSQGADPNATMEGVGTPLHRVAAAVAELPESSPKAAALGVVAEVLFDAGADPDLDGDTGTIPYDITYAARFGHAARVEQYCQRDPDAVTRKGLYNKTAFVIAVEANQAGVVRALLEQGAGPGAWAENRTAMETVLLGGSDELALMLLRHGFATPDEKSPLGGPLHLAAKQGRLALLDPLLDAGYRVDTKDARGNTPLHLACEEGQTAFAKALVERGADPLTWNNSGETALTLAESANRKDLYAFLKRRIQTEPPQQ